jgi:hypothetical protein
MAVNLVFPLPVAGCLVLLVIQRVAAPPEVKVLLVVLVDLVVVQEMVLGVAVVEYLVAVAVAVGAAPTPVLRVVMVLMAPVVGVVVAVVESVVGVVVAVVDLPVLEIMVGALGVAITAMVVMHHQDPVVAVAAPEVALILFITADTGHRGGYRSAASQPHSHFMRLTV